jgi:hypothetical protein
MNIMAEKPGCKQQVISHTKLPGSYQVVIIYSGLFI